MKSTSRACKGARPLAAASRLSRFAPSGNPIASRRAHPTTVPPSFARLKRNQFPRFVLWAASPRCPLLYGERAKRANSKAPSVTQKTPCLGAAGKSRGTGNGNLFVARRCEASGEAGMHRSEAEGRFGEAEPEGRASVCVEPILQAFGVDFKAWHGDESVKNACAHRGKGFTHFSNVAQNTLPETTSPA